jgi:hypothetical protein
LSARIASKLSNYGRAVSVFIDAGIHHVSPRRAYELIQILEKNDMNPSDVEVLIFESPDLGRIKVGSGDVYRRATALQEQRGWGEKVLMKRPCS